MLTGHTSEMPVLVVAQDASWLASADNWGAVRIWNPVTGTVCKNLTGHTGGVWALGVAPDGSWLSLPVREGRCGSGTSSAAPGPLSAQADEIRAAFTPRSTTGSLSLAAAARPLAAPSYARPCARSIATSTARPTTRASKSTA